MSPPPPATIDLGTHSLRAQVGGQGPPDFLCLHGLVDTLEIWDRVVGPLEQRGRVIRFDQRGHGESGAPDGPYTREDLAADVVGVLDQLGVERAILVGHSMGGIVSMATALAHPDRVAGLVLLGTASHCSGKVADWYEKIALSGERDGTAGLARRIYGPSSDREVHGDARGIAHVTRMLKSLYEDPLTPKLEGVRCPVLLVVGEKDPMGPKASEIIRTALPNGVLHVLPGCGHWTHVEAPDPVVALLDRWLSSTGAGSE